MEPAIPPTCDVFYSLIGFNTESPAQIASNRTICHATDLYTSVQNLLLLRTVQGRNYGTQRRLRRDIVRLPTVVIGESTGLEAGGVVLR